MTFSRHRLALSADEEKLFECLDRFVHHLRSTEAGHETLEVRIAGGWVRDKLLCKDCYDCDVTLSNMKGLDFAQRFVPFYQSHLGLPPENIRVAEIKANPEQSKHLDTATVSLLGSSGGTKKLDLDFCQLRSEEYGEGSRIPTEIKFGTPLQDALRRDLTINSLFYNVHTQVVEDHTDKGLVDLLEKPLIRTPLEPRQTFLDDPLRILRCIRFAVRFDFPLNADILEAVRLADVREALASKVSKERVGIEIKKMLSSRGAVEAIRHIVDLDLYPVVFAKPPRSEHEPQDIPSAPLAAQLLRDLLSPSSSLSPPSELTSAVNANDAFQLYLATALLPHRGQIFADKKGKSVAVPPSIVGEALKLPNDDAQNVGHLFTSADLVSLSTMSSFSGSDKRVSLGLLLPQLTGLKGPSWQTSLLFCLLLDLLPGRQDPAHVDATIQAYTAFVARIIELGLDRDAFAKRVLDGRDALSMGVQGKPVEVFLKEVTRYQLAHPSTTADECREHMTAWLARERQEGKMPPAVEGVAPGGGKKRKVH